MKNLLILGFLCLVTSLFGQVPTQTVRGKVYDSETNYPLYGVKIEINISETNIMRCASIEDGSFEIKNVLNLTVYFYKNS